MTEPHDPLRIELHRPVGDFYRRHRRARFARRAGLLAVPVGICVWDIVWVLSSAGQPGFWNQTHGVLGDLGVLLFYALAALTALAVAYGVLRGLALLIVTIWDW